VSGLDQGTTASAAPVIGHPGTKPLDPNEIERRFVEMIGKGQYRVHITEERSISVQQWRVNALLRWRAYSEALLGG
jgi:hypothetical protein